MPVAFNSRPMRRVTADLNERTIVGIEPITGFPNCSVGTIYRAPTCGRIRVRTIRYHNNPMDMIWHNHIRAQIDIPEMFGNGAPTFVRDFAKFIQLHLPIHNFPK